MITQEDVDQAELHWDQLSRQRRILEDLWLPLGGASLFWAIFAHPVALVGLPIAGAIWMAKNHTENRAAEAFALFMKLRDAHIDGS